MDKLIEFLDQEIINHLLGQNANVVELDDFDENDKNSMTSNMYSKYDNSKNTTVSWVSTDDTLTRILSNAYFLDDNRKLYTKYCRLYRIENYGYLLSHSERGTWMLLTGFLIKNDCGSCDGTTEGSYTIYEEKSLVKLLDIHLIKSQQEMIKLNLFCISTDSNERCYIFSTRGIPL